MKQIPSGWVNINSLSNKDMAYLGSYLLNYKIYSEFNIGSNPNVLTFLKLNFKKYDLSDLTDNEKTTLEEYLNSNGINTSFEFINKTYKLNAIYIK